MTKYVKTDYVPEDCDYLTAGKVYEVVEDIRGSGLGSVILADDNEPVSIFHSECPHLDDRPWTVWEVI